MVASRSFPCVQLLFRRSDLACISCFIIVIQLAETNWYVCLKRLLRFSSFFFSYKSILKKKSCIYNFLYGFRPLVGG